MVTAQGRIDLRIARWSIPTATTSARALGFAYTAGARRPSSAAAGALSYVHVNRIGVGQPARRSTARRSSAPSVVQTRCHAGVVPTDRAGLSRRPDRSVEVQPADRATSATSRATTTRARCRAGTCRCSASSVRSMLVDVAYVGNKADDLLLVANYNQAAPNNAAGTIPLAGAAADSDVRRHHLRLQRRQVALRRVPGQVRVADGHATSRSSAR